MFCTTAVHPRHVGPRLSPSQAMRMAPKHDETACSMVSLFLNEEWPCSAQRQHLYYHSSPLDYSSSVIIHCVDRLCPMCGDIWLRDLCPALWLSGSTDLHDSVSGVFKSWAPVARGTISPPLLLVACTAGCLTLRRWVWRQTNNKQEVTCVGNTSDFF